MITLSEIYEKCKGFDYQYIDVDHGINLLKLDLETTFGVLGNPKADLLFQKAYELGHSDGAYEIVNYYSNLIDLIKG